VFIDAVQILDGDLRELITADIKAAIVDHVAILPPEDRTRPPRLLPKAVCQFPAVDGAVLIQPVNSKLSNGQGRTVAPVRAKPSVRLPKFPEKDWRRFP
jgi:hypothetical protein